MISENCSRFSVHVINKFQLYYSGSSNNCMCFFPSSVLEYFPTLTLLSHIYVHNVSTVMLLVNIRGRTPAKYATFVAFLVVHQLESTLNLRAKVLKMRKEEKSTICLPEKGNKCIFSPKNGQNLLKKNEQIDARAHLANY